MASQTLTTRAVIQAVDNLTGPLSRMSGSVKQIAMTSQRHLDGLKASYAGFASKVNSIPIIGGGMAGAMGLAHVTHQLVEYDRKARQVQALNVMSAREWSQHQARFNAITDEFGIHPEKVLHAAEAYQQLVGSMKGFDQISRVAAKTSRITGTEMKDQVKEVNALARSFKLDATSKHDIERIERSYLVAAKGMMGGAHAFGAAMKSFAPVASMLGMDFETASAFVQTLGGQFEGGEIGTALKTTMLRVAAPKDPALKAMSAQGLSPLDYMVIDPKKLEGKAPGEALGRALAAGGFDPKGKGLDHLFKGLDMTSFEGRREFHKRYLETMSRPDYFGKGGKGKGKGKGGNKFEGTDRVQLMEIERQWLAGLGGKIDPNKMLSVLSKHKDNTWLMNRIWGTEHIAKGMDLLYQASHYEERLDHIRKASTGFKYVHSKGTGTIKATDAIDTRYNIVGAWKSISYQYDRMMGNMAAFWNVMSSKGTGGVLTAAFREMGNLFRTLQYTDPKVVQGVTAGLIGLAALPVGVFAVGAIAKSLGVVAALGMAPVRMLGALAKLPYAVAATGLLRMGAGARLMGAAVAGNALMGLGRFAGVLGTIARFTGMGMALGGLWYAAEHWGEVTEAFKNFSGTNAGKGMFAAFGALGETAKGLGADLVAVADNLFKILGWKSESPDGAGGAAGTLETRAGWATMLADALNLAATALRAIIADSEKLPSWAPKWAQDIYAGNRDLERQQREQGAAARQALTDGGFTGWVDYMLGQGKYDPWGGRFAPKKAWFDFTSPGPDALGVPGAFPQGSFQRYQLADATGPVSTYGFPTASEINQPIVDAQTSGASEVGGKVDAASSAIVMAINALAPAMAAAISGAVSLASFGGPAAASAPATGNATGIKR